MVKGLVLGLKRCCCDDFGKRVLNFGQLILIFWLFKVTKNLYPRVGFYLMP